MNLSIDLSQILKTYSSMKQDLNLSQNSQNLTSLRDLRDQLTLRELQLKSVLEISEKIIKHISPKPTQGLKDQLNLSGQDLKDKFTNLQSLYFVAEETLQRSKAEIKHLKAEVEKLEKSQGGNNLFTVEVYQSEIEDLRKSHLEKTQDFERLIKELQSSNLQRNFVELKKKYNGLKEKYRNLMGKIREFEEVLNINNEQRKATEDKYNILVKTHREMFVYIEKLEVKVKSFQAKHKGSNSNASDSNLKDISASSSQKSYEVDQPLSLFGPVLIFTI